VATVDFRTDVPINGVPVSVAMSSAALALGRALLMHGLIRFEEGKTDARNLTTPFIATVGAVSPTQVATLEQRIRQHQDRMARELAARAGAEIRNWGSALRYADTRIDKTRALNLIADALDDVLKTPPLVEATHHAD
jgi:hypothetical protein